MSETHFAMISDWMMNGNINEFVRENPSANRLKLVGFSFDASFYSSSLMVGRLLARRCSQGADVHPSPRNDPWGSQGCTFPMP